MLPINWIQKIEASKVEVKDAITERAFVPTKAGKYTLHCSASGHREAGMIQAS